MFAIDHHLGKVYAGDPDYDTLRGRLVGEYTVQRHDRRRNCTITTTYEVIDIGKPDPIAPVNPDAVLEQEEETLFFETPQGAANHARTEAAEQRHAAADPLIIAYLQEHGLTGTGELARHLDCTREWVRLHLSDREGTTYQRVRQGAADLWGLASEDYSHVCTLPRHLQIFAAALKHHGPMTVTELTKVTPIKRGSAMLSLKRYPDTFAIVEYRTRGQQQVAVWGLR